MTTLEKMRALIDEVKATPADALAAEAGSMGELLAIMDGLGFDPLSALLPTSEAEADVFVDKAIALLLRLRGDDLPPFDPDRYGEAQLT